MKKDVKLYNVIFPIWFLIFFPPVIFITLFGNFVIDSLVIMLCYAVFKLSQSKLDLKAFYKGSVLKVWLFGFAADIIGALMLFIINVSGTGIGLPNEFLTGINFDPFGYPPALFLIVFAMLLAAAFILFFNYRFTFRQIEDRKLRFKVALTIALVTMPWTFLLPTKWFYRGV
ncbi:MAG TPA: hypothetical protein VHT96_12005 [Clostridia bacterium]|nr:hypothetical protein [Clostridia bacterium]